MPVLLFNGTGETFDGIPMNMACTIFTPDDATYFMMFIFSGEQTHDRRIRSRYPHSPHRLGRKTPEIRPLDHATETIDRPGISRIPQTNHLKTGHVFHAYGNSRRGRA